tara:strand:- start:2207 stop:3763 length:1557 start_codon:yes stop_codon:yes gene_type:complete
MPIEKNYFSISPLNDNPLQSQGTNGVRGGFSFKESNPIIKFSIPAVEKMLETTSLTLSGQFMIKQQDTNEGFRNPTYANLTNDNGVNITKETACNMPNHGGVHNVIDKVVIQTKKTNTELINIHNYPAYSSLREAYTNNDEDYLWGNVANRSLAQGNNANLVNRRMNVVADKTAQDLKTNNNRLIGVPFSIKLDIDLFQSGNIALGQAFTNGLMLTIHLAPDSSVLSQRFRDKATTGDGAAVSDLANSMYVLRNVKLEGRYIVPTPQEMKAYQAVIPLNSQLNLLNDIHADQDSISYTPQLNSVKAMCNLYLDKDQTNNLAYQQANFRLPVGFKNIEHKKDNLRFPFTFPLKAQPNYESLVELGDGSINPAQMLKRENIMGDVELRKHFERALLGGTEAVRSSANMLRTKNNLEDDYRDRTNGIYTAGKAVVEGTAVATTNGVGLQLFPELLGLGVDYTYGVGNSMNYINRDYSNTVHSGVNAGSLLLPVDRRNKSELVQTFVKYNAQLNLQTLVKTM